METFKVYRLEEFMLLDGRVATNVLGAESLLRIYDLPQEEQISIGCHHRNTAPRLTSSLEIRSVTTAGNPSGYLNSSFRIF